jgi:GNAT superfamily N-acetyltransferase
MNIEIVKVKDKKTLKSFIKFPFKLYKGVDNYVPPLIDFEVSTLSPGKNPAFEVSEVKLLLAIQNRVIVGRIAGIILDAEKKDKNLVRFGWIDFIDDKDVSSALINSIVEWAADKGITGIHGPMGFTDFDFEGCLIRGFDELATQATIYNYPYYQEHFESLGFQKSCDWLEVRGSVPTELPRRIKLAASLISTRFKLYPKKFNSKKEILKYAPGVFRTLNASFQNLYGFYELTEKQIQYYVDAYFGFVRKEFVTVIVNEHDEVVACAITLPSISRALQKAKGTLFPFGFIHILRAFKKNDLLDMLLIGVHPDYQKLGASQLIFAELLSNFIDQKVKRVNTAIMLEENAGVLNLWNEFKEYETSSEIRRRCYIKTIER